MGYVGGTGGGSFQLRKSTYVGSNLESTARRGNGQLKSDVARSKSLSATRALSTPLPDAVAHSYTIHCPSG